MKKVFGILSAVASLLPYEEGYHREHNYKECKSCKRSQFGKCRKHRDLERKNDNK